MHVPAVITHLVALLILEAHNLILDAGAVAWPLRIHPAPIDRRLVQIGLDQRVRGGRGVCQVAIHLWPLHMHLWAEVLVLGKGCIPAHEDPSYLWFLPRSHWTPLHRVSYIETAAM